LINQPIKIKNMPLDTVNVSRTFHLGDSNFFKLGQSGTIAEDETREVLTDDALNFIHSTLKKYFPNAEVVAPSEVTEVKVVEEPLIGITEADILSCDRLKDLESYKFIVKSNPDLKNAYDKQFKNLCKQSK